MTTNRNKGFTMVELLMAMAFFSFILLFVVAGFIQINRSYTRGVTVKKVQDSARAVMEDVTASMRKSSSVQVINGGPPLNIYRLCLGGGVTYAWNQWEGSAYSNEQVLGEEINFVKSTDPVVCSANLNQEEFLSSVVDKNVRVEHFEVNQVTGTSNSYLITLVLSAKSQGTDTLSTHGEFAECEVRVGDQFCDVAKLETVVTIRN